MAKYNSSSLPRVSPEELKWARKAGAVPKRPAKPKAGASLTVMDNFLTRYKEWVKRVKSMAADGRRKDAVKKKIASL